MKLLTIILFSSLIWPSPFLPGEVKKPKPVQSASEQIDALNAGVHHYSHSKTFAG